jgi:hypothetical protein
MKAEAAMILWTPDKDGLPAATRGKVLVVQHPSPGHKDLLFSEGACSAEWTEVDHHIREKRLFILFHTLVVRDGIDAQGAHNAFLEIDEYRHLISPEIDGAEEPVATVFAGIARANEPIGAKK